MRSRVPAPDRPGSGLAMRILVTGAAGFIGFHVAARLLARGDAVTGFDNLNDYYDVALKEARLAELKIAQLTGELDALTGGRFSRLVAGEK